MQQEVIQKTQAEFRLEGEGDKGHFELVNDGLGKPTFTDLQTEIQDHPNGEFYTVLSGSDYGTATDFLMFCTTQTPNNMTANQKSHIHLNLRGVHAIRFVPTVGSGVPSLTVRGTIFTPHRN